jgi:hypothetical protein
MNEQFVRPQPPEGYAPVFIVAGSIDSVALQKG